MENENEKRRDIQERTFAFACRIVKLNLYLAKKGSVMRAISAQLLRSGTSIGANMEEADAAQSKKDFVCKCSIALKEARETHYWLRLLVNCGLIPLSRLDPLINEANEIVAILSTIVKKARTKIPSPQ
jgi:four helix bundle protein